MSERKFLPGLWLVDDSQDSNGVIPKEDAIAIVSGGDLGWDVAAVWADCDTSKSAKANANLIAAAPELLEALELLQVQIKLYYKMRTGFNSDKRLIEKAESAIKKALGE